MRCEICNKEIIYELSFKDLFNFKFICIECAKKYIEKETIIPIDYGYCIHSVYYSLESENSSDLDKYLDEKIVNFFIKNKKKMILLFDEDEINFYEYLNFKEDIYLINKTYIEIENIQIS